ncbi:Serine/threonine-protein kinase PknD [compost metagenome]
MINISALAGTLILSACGQSLPNLGMGQVSVARGQAVLMVKPQVIAGGYKAQALVENYKKSDINHLVIKVFELQGGVEVPVVDDEGNHVQVDLLNSELDVPVKFSNLFRDTTYRIRCYAYKAPGEAPADLISTLDASSYTDVTITNDNAPTVTPLRVRLADVVFNAEFTSGVDVTDGGFVRGGPVTGTKVYGANAVTTYAGYIKGFLDDLGVRARFDSPSGVAVDSNGNLFVADSANNAIRKVAPTGEVATLAGGNAGFLDGVGRAAAFNGPTGLVLGSDGTLYIADSGNNAIRKLSPDGTVSTLAGNSEFGYVDGPAAAAQFNQPSDIAVDNHRNIYVVDTFNHVIRKITAEGNVTTLAGNIAGGFSDGVGSAARFSFPKGITLDLSGNLFVADTDNHRIRKITPEGVVSTLAGDGFFSWRDGLGLSAQFDEPTGITLDPLGNLFVTDRNNYCVRKVSPSGEVTTLAGRGIEGFVDGTGTNAEFDQPVGITVDALGLLYVADRNNHRIRRVQP